MVYLKYTSKYTLKYNSMTKIIGIKDLQTKTKQIREEVEKGTHFIVVWRSKPIFEIKPLPQEDDINMGRTKSFIWDYDIKSMNLDDPEVMKWYLKRKIDYSDWESIDRRELEKYLPELDIDPSMKKLLSQFLQHEKNSHRKTKKISRSVSRK